VEKGRGGREGKGGARKLSASFSIKLVTENVFGRIYPGREVRNQGKHHHMLKIFWGMDEGAGQRSKGKKGGEKGGEGSRQAFFLFSVATPLSQGFDVADSLGGEGKKKKEGGRECPEFFSIHAVALKKFFV